MGDPWKLRVVKATLNGPGDPKSEGSRSSNFQKIEKKISFGAEA